MKKTHSVILMAAVITLSVLSLVWVASAEDLKTVIGSLTKIELAADGKSATAILKDNKTGDSIPIVIADELTLDKLKDKRIVEGDEIRCKYSTQGDKNGARIFKKTAGC